MESWIGRALADAGPNLIITLVVVGAAYNLLDKIGGRIVDALNATAKAQGEQATAMGSLTVAITGMTERDSSEHREMLILLRLLAQRTQLMEGSDGR